MPVSPDCQHHFSGRCRPSLPGLCGGSFFQFSQRNAVSLHEVDQFVAWNPSIQRARNPIAFQATSIEPLGDSSRRYIAGFRSAAGCEYLLHLFLRFRAVWLLDRRSRILRCLWLRLRIAGVWRRDVVAGAIGKPARSQARASLDRCPRPIFVVSDAGSFSVVMRCLHSRTSKQGCEATSDCRNQRADDNAADELLS